MITQIHKLITQIENRVHLRNRPFNLRNHVSNERGTLVLSMTILTALLCAITAYAVLQLAIAYARQGQFFFNRTPYRYATEAGIVWAQEQLWKNQGYCGDPDPPVINDIKVDVTVSSPCGVGVHTITAKATY